MADTWVVLFEAAKRVVDNAIAAADVARLLEELDPGASGGALHCPDRYALQVTTVASGPAEALLDVISRWSSALRRLGLPVWTVVRSEVLTPEELERDNEAALAGEVPTAHSARGGHDGGGVRALDRTSSGS